MKVHLVSYHKEFILRGFHAPNNRSCLRALASWDLCIALPAWDCLVRGSQFWFLDTQQKLHSDHAKASVHQFSFLFFLGSLYVLLHKHVSWKKSWICYYLCGEIAMWPSLCHTTVCPEFSSMTLLQTHACTHVHMSNNSVNDSSAFFQQKKLFWLAILS